MPIIKERDQLIYLLNEFKGMNRDGDKFNMPLGWIWDALNCHASITEDGQGAYQQRSGLTKLNSTVYNSATTKIRVLFQALWDDGTTNIIIRANTAWASYNSGTGAFDDFDAGRTADAKGQIAMFNNNIVYVDGGHPRKANSSLTDSDLSTDATLPDNATAIHVHRHRVWVNDPDNMQILGSAVDDATSATAFSKAGDSILIDLSYVIPDGDDVLAFRTFADTLLVVFCKNHIVVYDAPEVEANIQLVGMIDVGALGPHAFAEIGNQLVYPARSGVKTFTSSQATQKLDVDDLSAEIAPLYRSYVKLANDELAVCGAFNHSLNHYYLTVNTSTTTSETLVYTLDTKSFSGRYNFHANPFSMHEANDGTFYIGMDDGHVYSLDSTATDDSGTTIDFLLEFPYLGVETPHRYKAPIAFDWMIESNATVTLNVTVDYTLGDDDDYSSTVQRVLTVDESLWDEAAWDVAKWDESGRKLDKSHDLIGRGRLVGLKIEHSTKGSIVKIIWMALRTILEGEE